MRIPVFSILQILRRIVIVWASEVVALLLLARVLPGLQLRGWQAAIVAVAAIGLLNALVRPVLLFFVMPITLMTFGLVALVLNAAILFLAANVVPGMTLANPGTAFLVAIGLAMINMLFARLLSLDDEDSFYRNVVRRIGRRSVTESDTEQPGIIYIEIDGLSRTVFEQALAEGHMPTLERWLSGGTHRFVQWDCGLPSQSSSSQAGILHGNNFDIPAFRWYDKDRGRLIVSNHPADAMLIEEAVSNGQGLLRDGGLSVCNMLSGDAAVSVATMSTFPKRSVQRASPIYFNYYINPYNFIRGVVLTFAEMFVELFQSTRARLRNVQPRVSRGGWFPFLRAASTVLQRDISVYLVTGQMFSGIPSAYTTFVGYDVVAHHAGCRRADAMGVLRDIDQRIRNLRRAADDAPRPYHFVILSDHGHSPAIPFRQLYHQTLDQLVRTLVSDSGRVHAPTTPTESWGHLNALLTDAIQYERLASRAARRILRSRTRDGFVELGAREQRRETPPEEVNVMVCASGNLGHIYFTDLPGRIEFETIATRHPQLIEGLVAHEGIDFVLAHSAARGPLV
ncbi:MAG: phage holin family protein, partial [Candidatus Krumholzibacteriota bacterium]|nr:phage holin family protein [Candidatus Krumholzibacteriota bacterium]